MPITVCLDGSSTTDPEVLTLAAVVMADDLKERFAENWNTVLARHGMTALHMREDSAARALQTDLLNLVGRFREEFFYTLTASVLLPEYAAARIERPTLPSAASVCVQCCLGGLMIPEGDRSRPDSICVRFDPSEPFLRHVDPHWRKIRRRSDTLTWAHQIGSLRCWRKDDPDAGVNSVLLQTADLIAWSVSRHVRKKDRVDLAISALIMWNHFSRVYDRRLLLACYNEDGKFRQPSKQDLEESAFSVSFD